MAEDYGASGGTTYVNTGSVASGAIGAAANIFGTLYNNWQAGKRERDARRENYLYNEMAANAADTRTRALYNDLYSPQAQLQQIKDAGLSPSVFYGDGGGISGQSGAQGAGPNGISPNVYGLDPLAAAQVALTMAQTQKTKAETQNVNVDTIRQNIQKDIEVMKAGQYKNQWTLLNSVGWGKYTEDPNSPEGSRPLTLYEYAGNFKSYEEFSKEVINGFKDTNNWDMLNYCRGEYGQQDLRAIYFAKHALERDIAVLSSDKVAAQFQESIANALKSQGFASKNAEAAIKQLEASIETSNLTIEQKKSWNDLIGKLRESAGDTTADIIIVLAMILNNAATNWVNTSVGVSNSTTQSTSTVRKTN